MSGLLFPPNTRFCIDMSDKRLHYTQHGVGCRLDYLVRTRLTVTKKRSSIYSPSTKVRKLIEKTAIMIEKIYYLT